MFNDIHPPFTMQSCVYFLKVMEDDHVEKGSPGEALRPQPRSTHASQHREELRRRGMESAFGPRQAHMVAAGGKHRV